MMLDRRTAILGALALSPAGRSAAQTNAPATTTDSRHLTFADPEETVDLWPGSPPGAPARLPVETVRERSAERAYNDRYMLGIGRPRMAVFRPTRPNGSAALIFPGGGYRWVVIDKEGYELARWLAERGTTAFVLFYRLPSEGWSAGPDVAVTDAVRAMRIIRHRAAGFGIDASRICSIGFSAGGHVCASLLTRFAESLYAEVDAADRLSARPDGAAPIYPVISMSPPAAHAGSRAHLIGERVSNKLERRYTPSLHVPANAPPTFLLHAEDDASVPVENSLMLRSALRDHNVSVETHLFADGGHGFGLRLARGKSVEGWENLLHTWGQRQGIFA